MKTNEDILITTDSPTETKVFRTAEVIGRNKRPEVPAGISLSGNRKVLDYGHVCSLMQEKYGDVRGEAMYQGMVDKFDGSGGRFFVVGQAIQREKLAMMMVLGKHGDPDNHHYQGLYVRYFEKLNGNKAA